MRFSGNSFSAAVWVLVILWHIRLVSRCEVSDDNQLVPEQQDTPVTSVSFVVAKLDVSEAAWPHPGSRFHPKNPSRRPLRLRLPSQAASRSLRLWFLPQPLPAPSRARRFSALRGRSSFAAVARRKKQMPV